MASIYQSAQTSEQADIAVENPFLCFREFTKDKALDSGSLYFGLVGRDGEVEENRKRVYVILESGGAVPIDQPVQLSAGGIPMHGGNPVQLAVDGSYSLKVLDKGGAQVYYTPKVVAKSLLGYSGIIPEEVKTKLGSELTFSRIEASTATFYVEGSFSPDDEFNGNIMLKDVDYEVVNESTIRFLSSYADGLKVLGRVLDPTGQTVKVSSGSNPIYIFDTQADAIQEDLSAGDSVIINGKNTSGDGLGGSYLVSTTGITPDGFNYIDMDNGAQLHIKKSYQALGGISESVTSLSPVSGKFTIDPTVGSVFKLDLSANVTEIEILNTPGIGELKIEIKVTQASGGPFTMAWNINGLTPKAAGGTLPTVTATANAVDRFVIVTDDAGNSFEVYTAGQDIK